MIRSSIFIGVLSFLAGFGTHLLISRPVSRSVAEHWHMLEKARAHSADPMNREPDSSGHFVLIDTLDIMPSLAALVSAGELEHVDIVFPGVSPSKETDRFWMEFTNSRDDIVYATGNPTYTYYQVRGEQPLHLNLWFKPSARAEVQSLIKQLEERNGS